MCECVSVNNNVHKNIAVMVWVHRDDQCAWECRHALGVYVKVHVYVRDTALSMWVQMNSRKSEWKEWPRDQHVQKEEERQANTTAPRGIFLFLGGQTSSTWRAPRKGRQLSERQSRQDGGVCAARRRRGERERSVHGAWRWRQRMAWLAARARATAAVQVARRSGTGMGAQGAVAAQGKSGGARQLCTARVLQCGAGVLQGGKHASMRKKKRAGPTIQRKENVSDFRWGTWPTKSVALENGHRTDRSKRNFFTQATDWQNNSVR